MEGGVETVALHREGPVPGDEILPGEGAGPLEKGIEVPGGEGAQHEEHPFSGAKIQIEAGNVRRTGPAEDPTIFRAYVGQAQAAQLFRRKTLQPEQSGYGQFQMFHHCSDLQTISLLYDRL